MDHSLPRFSSAHGLLQAGVPEWVAFAFSVGLYLMVGGKETGCVRLAESHPCPGWVSGGKDVLYMALAYYCK